MQSRFVTLRHGHHLHFLPGTNEHDPCADCRWSVRNAENCRKAERTEDAEIVGKARNAEDTVKATGQGQGFESKACHD